MIATLHTLTLSTLLALLIGITPIAFASEVTGTLSSDGSKEQTETMTTEEVATPQTPKGSLQGAVVAGREESKLQEAVTNMDASLWIAPIAGIGFVALAFFLWRRMTAV